MNKDPSIERQSPGMEATTKPRFRMLVPIWGASYFDRWFELAAASLQSNGNVPFLCAHADFELVLLTKQESLPVLLNHHCFKEMEQQCRIKTIMIDEFFSADGKVPYGIPLTLAYAKGVQDLGAEGLGTYVILMNADFVLSDGSLATLFQRVQEGFNIITAPSIRVVDNKAGGMLRHQLHSRGREQAFAAREMMSVVEQCLHQTVLGRILNWPQIVEAWYYHVVYWRLSPTCLAARSFLLMPMCFQLRRQIDRVVSPVDYGFLAQVCPGGRYTALTDSDEFLMVELQHRDSESQLLKPAQPFSSLNDRIEQTMNVVASNAAIWTTVEHRRAAQHTLLYHSTDVTEEQHVSLKEFEERMSRMLVRLPPPLPETRHFQWVPSVDVYRAAMPEAAYPRLLADDRNRTFHLLWEYEQVASGDAPITATAIAGTDAECLIRHLSEATTIITLDELLLEVVTNLKPDRIFSSPVKDAHHLDMDVDLLFPPDYGPGEGETLGIYLLLDTLAHWPKFRKSCDAFLARGGRVVALFSTIGGAAFELEDPGHSWVLALLTHFFFNDADRAELEIIPSATPPKHPHSPSLRNRAPETTTSYCTGFIVRLGSRCNTGE